MYSLVRGVKLIFTRGHVNLTVAFKGPNVILGASSVLPPGGDKVPGWIKQGGGPDWAHGPCVCHLCVSRLRRPSRADLINVRGDD